MVAESGTSLEASLGSPQQYAEELRRNRRPGAGPREAVPVLRRFERAVAGSSLWPRLVRLSQQPTARAFSEFVPTLRPAWWLVRGWLWLFAVVVWLHNGELAPYRARIVVPSYHGNWFLGVLALAVALVTSVWVGLRQGRLPQSGRRAIGVVSAVVVLFGLSHYGDAENIASGGYSGSFAPVAYAAATPAPYHGITFDGRHPLNIYPYDREGHLLSGVRLFDDRGVPLQGLGKSAPGGVVVRVLPSDVAGGVVANEYPQQLGILPKPLPPTDGSPVGVPTVGADAASAYAQSTPMPTPTIFVPPMAGASPSPTPVPTASVAPLTSQANATTPAATTSPVTSSPVAKSPAVKKPSAKTKPKPTSGAR